MCSHVVLAGRAAAVGLTADEVAAAAVATAGLPGAPRPTAAMPPPTHRTHIQQITDNSYHW